MHLHGRAFMANDRSSRWDDFSSLDDQVRGAAKEVERVTRDLSKTKDDRDLARRFGPFTQAPHREAAGQTTFNLLRDKAGASPLEEAHRCALQRWVLELLQTRVSWELIVDLADAAHAVDPSSSPSSRKPQDEVQPTKTYAEAHQALIEAEHPTAADRALARLDQLALPVLAVKNELRSRRQEASRRLGLDHPLSLLSAVRSPLEIQAVARSFLDQTELLAGELHRSARRRVGLESSAAALTIWDGFGRDAQEGWPAHLGARFFEDVFRAIISTERVPRSASTFAPLGAASFSRAAMHWGYALRLGATPRSLPFALARDPYPIEAIALGDVLGITIGQRAFAKRKLGLATRSADQHFRVLSRVMFQDLRVIAAKTVLAASATRMDAQEVIDLSRRVFGGPLPANLAALWSHGEGLSASPSSLSSSSSSPSPVQFLAALRADLVHRTLMDRFDEDWFDNPRSATHLASIGAGPVWSGGDADVMSALLDAPHLARMVKTFEECLG